MCKREKAFFVTSKHFSVSAVTKKRYASRRVLACYEKERRDASPEECSHVTKKSVARRRMSRRVLACYEKDGGQSTGADTGSRRAVDRGGHGQSEGSRPGSGGGAE